MEKKEKSTRPQAGRGSGGLKDKGARLSLADQRHIHFISLECINYSRTGFHRSAQIQYEATQIHFSRANRGATSGMTMSTEQTHRTDRKIPKT